MTAPAPGQTDTPPPVFMFGFERSGTTLLSMMVGAHPRIAVPLSVTGLWYRYGSRLDAYNQLAETADLERMIDDLLREERIRLWDVELDRETLLEELGTGSYGAVISRFHQAYANAKGKPCWANLDIATLDHMDQANQWFPEARFVHIVRDGRDVALSHRTMPYGASNTLDCAERWVHRVDSNLKMGRILGPERYHVVRFEDLVLESEATLEGLCDFIGIDYSDRMLEYGQMVEEKVPEDRRWLWPDLARKPVGTKVGTWRHNMSRPRRIVFEGVARDMLRQLGYETWDRVPKHPLAYVHEAWCFLDRGGRMKRLAIRTRLWRGTPLERRHDTGGGSYRDVQASAFGDLVNQGVFSERFEHAGAQKDFFRDAMESALGKVRCDGPPRVLDCGCGPGAWLDYLGEVEALPDDARLYGFDLTREMAEVARKRLEKKVPADHIATGDVLDDDSYQLIGEEAKYDLIFTYDVVQQMPRKLQYAACESMLRHLADGGCLVVFDHDSESEYGRRMGRRKFITRYFGIPLVPRYFCNARYPALARFARKLQDTGRFVTEMRVAPNGRKRALTVRHADGPAGNPESETPSPRE